VLAWRGSELIGALPLYRKSHSYGEFIFDWSWANAAHHSGVRYYPKLVCAAPFSPVGGARFLLSDSADPGLPRRLLETARSLAQADDCTGLHLLFLEEDEAALCDEAGFAVRHTYQFHWTNEGYQDFECFLARFRSKRRHQIRRERRLVREAGVSIRVVEGDAITPGDMALAWRFYLSTIDKLAYGRRYLTPAFFDYLYASQRARLVLIFAECRGETIAGTVNLQKDGVLYGRYWGCAREVPFVHFEVCCYAGVELAIERGWRRFEAGAGGHHKFGRGFLPVVIRSAHELYIEGLDEAVRDAIAAERAQLGAELGRLEGCLFK
jgi:predicted N-acyltransferase